MLSPTVRLLDLEELIQQRSYFVLHAPRQTGKTTAMLALATNHPSHTAHRTQQQTTTHKNTQQQTTTHNNSRQQHSDT